MESAQLASPSEWVSFRSQSERRRSGGAIVLSSPYRTNVTPSLLASMCQQWSLTTNISAFAYRGWGYSGLFVYQRFDALRAMCLTKPKIETEQEALLDRVNLISRILCMSDGRCHAARSCHKPDAIGRDQKPVGEAHFQGQRRHLASETGDHKRGKKREETCPVVRPSPPLLSDCLHHAAT